MDNLFDTITKKSQHLLAFLFLIKRFSFSLKKKIFIKW